jgi:hypothetical protein
MGLSVREFVWRIVIINANAEGHIRDECGPRAIDLGSWAIVAYPARYLIPEIEGEKK